VGVDFRESVGFSDFKLFFALFLDLPLFVPFVGVAVFFLFYMIFFSFSWLFWPSSCAL
jgi:hypothetical protein